MRATLGRAGPRGGLAAPAASGSHASRARVAVAAAPSASASAAATQAPYAASSMLAAGRVRAAAAAAAAARGRRSAGALAPAAALAPSSSISSSSSTSSSSRRRSPPPPAAAARRRPPSARCDAAPSSPPAAAPATALAPSTATFFEDLAGGGAKRKYVMVSGKGGVGKTSLSASLAVRLAQEGHTVLVVSTDPAHSLSDALGQDVSGGEPVPVEGTDLPLWGMEIDAEAGTREFLSASAAATATATAAAPGEGKDGGNGNGNEGNGGGGGGLRGAAAAAAAGAASSLLSGLGLGGFMDQLKDLKLGELLSTPPPGLDEAVAVAKVVQFVQSAEYARFTRIVFDTAPTGHTLRLLTLPDFVEASLGKVIRLRRKLGGAADAVRGAFGAASGQDAAVAKLEALRDRVRVVKDLFRDASQTEFVIATIPTVLGVSESARLLASLRAEGVPCRALVVNQVLGDGSGEAFLRLKAKDQASALKGLQSDPALQGLEVVQAPLLDLEVRGLPALEYFGRVVWRDEGDPPPAALADGGGAGPAIFGRLNSDAGGGGVGGGGSAAQEQQQQQPQSAALVDARKGRRRRFYMLGGKGGVGKTSCSAALAVRFASPAGGARPTLVVSTDPAHSLSDAFDQDLSGGKPVRVEGSVHGSAPGAGGDGGDGGGDGGDPVPIPLWGMQIDLDGAKAELRAALEAGGAKGFNDFLDSLGLGAVAAQLKDLELGELMDSPPPGVDEAVAIARVVQLLSAPEYAHFERVVFDTAPTGHTLRLLTLPDFVDASVGKIIRLRARLTAAADAVRSFVAGGKRPGPDPAVAKLDALSAEMQAARALFRDADSTEFLIVTIPTAMAAAESARLAAALRKEGVPLRAVVVNQVLPAAAGDAYLSRRRADQARSLARIAADREGLGSLQLTEAPLLDLEVRGVAALSYFGNVVWR